MTIFQIPAQKYPRFRNFGGKFRHFYFFVKFCSKKNLRTLISNMPIVFSNSRANIRKWGIFGHKFEDFSFCTKICNKANSRAFIFNMTMVFQNCCPKHPNQAVLVPNLIIFIFALNFVFQKIRGYFKLDNSFFF